MLYAATIWLGGSAVIAALSYRAARPHSFSEGAMLAGVSAFWPLALLAALVPERTQG